MLRTAICSIGLVALTACQLASQSPLHRQADSLLTAMTAAFKAGAATTATYYTDDAALIGGGRRVVGREGVNRYWAGTTPGSTWSLQLLDVGGEADAPWVHGKSSLAPPGAAPFVTEFLGLLQRGADGRLRFRVDAYAASRGAQGATAASEAAVRGLDSLWGRMYAKHDTAAAMQLYSPQLVFVSANGRQKTLADEMGDIRPAPGLVMDYFRTTPAEVRAFEQMAVVRGVVEWKFAMSGGAPREIRRPYMAVYSRGGPLGWRIVAIQMR